MVRYKILIPLLFKVHQINFYFIFKYINNLYIINIYIYIYIYIYKIKFNKNNI